MSEEIYCRVPDQLGSGGDCRWGTTDVPWALIDNIPGVPEEDYRKASEWADRQIMGVCGVKLKEVQSASGARVLLTSQRIDGPGGTLAQAELPCGRIQRVRLWCDSTDRWDVQWKNWGDRVQSGRIPLYLVVLHEKLHNLGLPHTNQPGNVMNPSLQTGLRRLGDWDISELRRRYGPPVAPPPVPTPTPTPVPTPAPAPGGDGFFGGLKKMFWNLFKGLLLKAVRSAVEGYDAKKTEEPYDDVVKQLLLYLLDALEAGTLGKVETVRKVRALVDDVKV